MGVSQIQVEELFSLDEDSLRILEPVYGLLFLFKWTGSKVTVPTLSSSSSSSSSPSTVSTTTDDISKVLFMKQVVNNACGTQALLHILLNQTNRISLGPLLTEFRSFIEHMDPTTAGTCLGHFEPAQKIHNSFARPEPFIIEERKQKNDEDEDIFHFVSLTQVGNTVFEMDGLQSQPLPVGTVTNDKSWITIATDRLQKRIAEYTQSEIRFNVMALVHNRLILYYEQYNQYLNYMEEIYGILLSTGFLFSDESLRTPDYYREQITERTMKHPQWFGLSSDTASSNTASLSSSTSSLSTVTIELADTMEKQTAQYKDITEKLTYLLDQIDTEIYKRTNYTVENNRRRHNFVPFIITLMKELASRNKLQEMYDQGFQKEKYRRETLMKEKMNAIMNRNANNTNTSNGSSTTK